ncbi:MAG TPA: hypothetical protein VFM91_08885 [Propionibacteriaceae bacterium]|nr:hypothetical protein [Propionibacteriaceae bacterium]
MTSSGSHSRINMPDPNESNMGCWGCLVGGAVWVALVTIYLVFLVPHSGVDRYFSPTPHLSRIWFGVLPAIALLAASVVAVRRSTRRFGYVMLIGLVVTFPAAMVFLFQVFLPVHRCCG